MTPSRLELAHGVEGHQAVGILIGDGGVVAGMHGVEFLGVERSMPLTAIVVKRVGRPGSILSGLPSVTRPPSVTSAITADFKSRMARPVCREEFRRSNLGRERLAANFRQQHVDGALGRRLGGEFIALDAARKIAFVFRSP